MRVILSEDVIRRALNESIDEFIMEETLWEEEEGKPGSTAEKYGKKAWSGLKKLGNWAKNSIAMYMDKSTGGRWNQKYNIQAKGNGLSVGSFYLKKWFEIHYNRLYDIIYGTYYGNRTYYYTEINGKDVTFHHDWRKNTYTIFDRMGPQMYKYALELDNRGYPYILSVYNYEGSFVDSGRCTYNKATQLFTTVVKIGDNGEAVEKGIGMGEDDSTPETYVEKNCTFQNFRGHTKNTLGDGDFTEAVEFYINNKIQRRNNLNKEKLKDEPDGQIDYKPLLNSFTMNAFNWWYGKYYNAQKQRQAKKDERQAQADKQAEEARQAQAAQQTQTSQQTTQNTNQPKPQTISFRNNDGTPNI